MGSEHDTPAHPMDEDVKTAVRDAKKRFSPGDIKLFFGRLAASVKHHPWWSAVLLIASLGACKLCVYFAGTIIAGGIICATMPKETAEHPE